MNSALKNTTDIDMTENNYLIYALQSPSGRLYVGQTNNYNNRMRLHQREYSGCVAIRDAIQKHGWENIKHFILMEDLSLEEANYWEEHYISIFDCQAPNGYNLTSGGDNFEVSQITKDRMSVSGKAAHARPEVKANHKAAKMGDKNPMKIPEVKARHKAAMNSPEVKEKHREAVKAAMNKHENKELTRLTTQLQWHEKHLEAAGLL